MDNDQVIESLKQEIEDTKKDINDKEKILNNLLNELDEDDEDIE